MRPLRVRWRSERAVFRTRSGCAQRDSPGNSGCFQKGPAILLHDFPHLHASRRWRIATSLADPEEPKSSAVLVSAALRNFVQFASNALRVMAKGRIMPVLRRVTRGIQHGCRNVRGNFCMVLESLVATYSRPDRDDGDLVAAIRLDAVHRPAQSETRNDAGGVAVDVLAAHHPADLVLAAAGLPR